MVLKIRRRFDLGHLLLPKQPQLLLVLIVQVLLLWRRMNRRGVLLLHLRRRHVLLHLMLRRHLMIRHLMLLVPWVWMVVLRRISGAALGQHHSSSLLLASVIIIIRHRVVVARVCVQIHVSCGGKVRIAVRLRRVRRRREVRRRMWMPRRRRRRRVRMELVIPHPVHGPLWWHIRRRRVQTAQSGLGVVLQTARPHVVSVLLTPPHIDESRVVRLSSSSFARSCFCVVSSFAPLYVNTDDDDVDDATTRVIKASTIIHTLSLSLFLDHNHNKQTTTTT